MLYILLFSLELFKNRVSSTVRLVYFSRHALDGNNNVQYPQDVPKNLMSIVEVGQGTST